MKTATKVWAGVISVITLLFQVPAVQQAVVGFFTAHPGISTVLGGVSSIIALLHSPEKV